MARRKRHKPHANHERWLVSYADFITLLFAFFVVLYASSQVDNRQVGKLALAIQVAFQELGVFPASSTQVPLDSSSPMPFASAQIIQNTDRKTELGRLVAQAADATSTDLPDPVSKLRAELEKALEPELKKQAIAITSTRNGVVISLREIGFFQSGSAEFQPKSGAVIDSIARILQEDKHELRIEGHTDNVPIHNAAFASNWELSTARSMAVMKLFIYRYHFSPERLSTAGYAEFHPVSENGSETGRSQNRRVDIVIVAPARPLPRSLAKVELPNTPAITVAAGPQGH